MADSELVELSEWEHHKNVFVNVVFVIFCSVVKIVFRQNKRLTTILPESW